MTQRASRAATLLHRALLVLALALPVRPVPAGPYFDPETERLLVEAVTAAIELDLFHTHCRSDRSNRRTENLNKLIASKYRITVIGVLDDLFPERSYRRAQERLQGDLAERLRVAGGCRGAREAGIADALAERYQTLYATIETLP